MTVTDNRVVDPPAATAVPEDPRDPRVRLAAFFDEGSLRLITAEDDSAALSAVGRISGMPAVAFANDARIQGGAMGTAGCAAIEVAYEHAVRERIPVVGLWHSGGARLAEGVESLHAVGRVFAAMTRASGIVPQISVVLGPAAGGAAYGPALTDVVVMSQGGKVFVTGPDVVRSVTGEQITADELGGVDAHGRRSGVVHVTAPDDTAAMVQGRRLALLLGHQGQLRTADVLDLDLGGVLPESARRAYDVKPLVNGVLDSPLGEESVELQAKYAPNMVTALGRLGGRTVGIVANNPLRLGGCLDSKSAEKAARFVRMCDSFGVPLIVMVDTPGYLPGVGQEWDGVVRRGAKLLHAFAEATVPRVTLVTRKSYGGAYIAMNSRSLGATRVFAWPTAEVAVMGPVAAVRILHRKKLAAVPAEERPALEAELAAEQEKKAGGLERARELGVVDEVVLPERTRSALAEAIATAPSARGAHGNIPL
ncbi:acyl-CoA carboxylase subunit beta [Marinitenerispora sediminis]|uniref:Propionyl-CoA carboxylase subunit beta n=1 Tax=Marinitenerispora sediminis TaxID=1931232 RepID=A0A368SYD9_9ACTN|nr:carboxyl transferase domain-containing protein [Marinitenerispora sediminis]RCV49198.1 propionyl-CoA carboxylase subunit beta [Marinitenerispora sediminis]RCV54580.1 propionyl-CoA carboxylase subunit beta [Marinitenerispora sediminis]RCV59865.1 propionyl-CoA carboxylase subunit beta [Marinitenerispora sediminis]